MLKSKYNWNVLNEGIIASDDIYNRILKNRGIEDSESFFSMGEEVFHDPFFISNMEKAVERIEKAIKLQEPIVIYGDYDCDGITAISVLMKALRKKNANVSYDLPNRFSDGYGLNMRASQEMIDEGVKLVITVDNGITCMNEVDLLQESGVDVIVTDHHEGKDTIPNAFAIIHPKYSPNYPFKEIAGVMVAYKLASALYGENIPELYDLVMIGTIADLMPLTDENQAMVNLGLKQLKHTENAGLKKLVESSHLDYVNEAAIAFKIAPKINSSGRLGKAKEAVELLICETESCSSKLIFSIEESHNERKDLTEEAFQKSDQLVRAKDDVLIIYSPDLHEGVIGICAQRLAEKYQKSTAVITLDEEGHGKGSMRSYGGDNILDMLTECSSYLTRFGGHAQAAGLQIDVDRIDAFRKAIQSYATKTSKALSVDMEVTLSNLKIDVVQKLEEKSFFTALFLFRGLEVSGKQKLGEKHTKLYLRSHGKQVDGLQFQSLEYYYQCEVGDIVDVVCGLSINEWRGRKTLQLMIKDMRISDFQIIDLRNKDAYIDSLHYIHEMPYAIDDTIGSREEFFQKLNEAKESTLYLLPRTDQAEDLLLIQKATYQTVYRLIQEDPTTVVEHSPYTDKITKKVLEVFEDLNFIHVNGNEITLLEQTRKTPLEYSKIYQKYKENHHFMEHITHEAMHLIMKLRYE